MSNEKSTEEVHIFQGWDFSTLNYILFGVGLLLIIFGYIIMAMGDVNSFQSLSVAPVMLFVGYVIMIPLSLILRDKSKTNHIDASDNLES